MNAQNIIKNEQDLQNCIISVCDEYLLTRGDDQQPGCFSRFFKNSCIYTGSRRARNLKNIFNDAQASNEEKFLALAAVLCSSSKVLSKMLGDKLIQSESCQLLNSNSRRDILKLTKKAQEPVLKIISPYFTIEKKDCDCSEEEGTPCNIISLNKKNTVLNLLQKAYNSIKKKVANFFELNQLLESPFYSAEKFKALSKAHPDQISVKPVGLVN